MFRTTLMALAAAALLANPAAAATPTKDTPAKPAVQTSKLVHQAKHKRHAHRHQVSCRYHQVRHNRRT